MLMRTTITLADDVVAAIEHHRRETSVGLSEAVNDLVRAGLRRTPSAARFEQKSYDLRAAVDYTNIADTLETLDGPGSR